MIILASLAWWMSKSEFTLREVSYSDDAVDVELIEPIPSSVVQPAPPPEPRTTLGPDGEVLRPQAWVKQPVPNFPELALRRGVEQGVVVLRCETLVTGEFGACEVVSETPQGAGFGEAALAATRQARVTPYSIDGFDTDGSIQFTVRFRAASEP
ncbi:TonB family protein [Brevundimonas sp.]|uniref:TonB family protein n=1 Tax=Brevundimonas sp. TaxID=1871086 RepID=UPI002BB5B0C1|nr:TonB family protein [Brevundimonas sp.]HWQ85360.1 TonB family protein [Brevundimonas sp.]